MLRDDREWSEKRIVDLVGRTKDEGDTLVELVYRIVAEGRRSIVEEALEEFIEGFSPECFEAIIDGDLKNFSIAEVVLEDFALYIGYLRSEAKRDVR